MIQANELRIGNKVFIGIENINIFEVEAIITDPYEVYVKGIDYDYHLDIEPIPLTPEILEAAGFVNLPSTNNSLFVLRGDTALNEIQLILDYEGCNFCSYPFYRKFKYLHEIQNLVYLLTGKELTINIPVNENHYGNEG